MTDQEGHIKDDLMQAYLDGTLDTALREKIQSHLTGCQQCRKELARLETLSYHLETLPEIGLSRDLSGLVVSRLKAERSLSPAITWTLVAEALAAGVVISMLIPAFQAAGWIPRLLDIRQALGAGLNTFLAQLASSWLVWWAELQVQLNQLLISFNPLESLPLGGLSPWVIVGTAGGLVILVNSLLLGRQSLPNGNHQSNQV